MARSAAHAPLVWPRQYMRSSLKKRQPSPSKPLSTQTTLQHWEDVLEQASAHSVTQQLLWKSLIDNYVQKAIAMCQLLHGPEEEDRRFKALSLGRGEESTDAMDMLKRKIRSTVAPRMSQ